MIIQLKIVSKLDGDRFYHIVKDGALVKVAYISTDAEFADRSKKEMYALFNKIKTGETGTEIILETFNTEDNGQIPSSTESK